jgi:spore coat protein CotH
MYLLWLVLAGCTGSGAFVGEGETQAPPEGPKIVTGDGDTGPDTADTADTESSDTDSGPDQPPSLFSLTEVHELVLDLTDEQWTALQTQPNNYARATLTAFGTSMTVGVRVKGSSTWQPVSQKPSLKIKLDEFVDGQSLYGIESFNLHNNTVDPSMMGENIAYWLYREADLPAPRTGYATLVLQGQYKGLYGLVEQKNSEFLDQWFDSDEGSLYEAGGDNWPCDFDDNGPQGAVCDCYEVDQEGSEDTRADLELLCQDTRIAADDEWLAAMKRRFDWERALGSMAMDMAVAHWDSYGGNLNNYHIYHDPSTDTWTFSPWSADLAFGWYPWDNQPCGMSMTNPQQYQTGALTQRCWGAGECRDELQAKLLAHADLMDSVGIAARIATVQALIAPYIPEETFWSYNPGTFANQVACVDAWLAQRPGELRAMYAP